MPTCIVETTDGAFVQVAQGEWWFTAGMTIYPQSMVDLWLRRHPGVGVAVTHYV